MSSPSTRRTFLKAAAAAAGAATATWAQRGTPVPQAGVPQGGSTPPPKTARVTSSLMLWTIKGTFEEKLATAARVGFQSVELVSEQLRWTDANSLRYRDLVQSYGMTMDALLGQRDWTRRPVTMVNPAHREGFLQDVRDAIVWAKKLRIPQIIMMSGNEQPGMTHEAQYASMVESARQAAAIADQEDVKLILENLNSKVDHHGYFLTSAKEALQVVKEVDNPHFRFLFDLYHEFVQNGDPIPLIPEAAPYVAVFHVADAPGRHDPGTGEMKWDDIYKAIAKANYAGYIAMEYRAQGDEVESLMKSVTQMRKDLNSAAGREPAANPA